MSYMSVPLTIVRRKENGTSVIYKRHEELGRGGFAVVYRVTNFLTGEDYALKAIPKEKVSKPKKLSKLRSEISIQKSLNHPNLLKSYDTFEDTLNYYIVLELCPNNSVKDRIKAAGRLSEDETASILKDVIQGLIYLHDNQIIHRDLKPENFLFGKDGNVKIADFGLSTRLYFPDERKHTVCGTPNYLSPELVSPSFKGHSYEVDIWAIGVSAFAMLTGHPPFESTKKTITYENIKNCQYHFPYDFRISPISKDFIQSILKINPEKRPSALDLLTHAFIRMAKPLSVTLKNLTNSNNQNDAKSSNINQENNENNNGMIMKKPLYFQYLPTVPSQQAANGTNITNMPTVASIPTINFMPSITNMPNIPNLPSMSATPNTIFNPIPPNTPCQPSALCPPSTPYTPFTQAAPFNPNVTPFRQNQFQPKNENIYMSKDKTKQNLTELKIPKFFVTRFCDNSDKVGLGYLLLDGTTGVIFNDGSRMVMDPHETFIQYWEEDTQIMPTVLDLSNSDNVSKKIAYLHVYASTLKKTKTMFALPSKQYNKNVPLKHVKYWTKASEATLFRFDDRNVQVNFDDHQKLFIFPQHKRFFMIKSIKEQAKLINFSEFKNYETFKEEFHRFSIAKGMLSALKGNINMR